MTYFVMRRTVKLEKARHEKVSADFEMYKWSEVRLDEIQLPFHISDYDVSSKCE